MAGLADDWPENRQTCIDVMCGYMRIPYKPDPGQNADTPERLAFLAIRGIRHTVIRVITAHLRKDKKDDAKSWQGLNFDFTGVVFDGGDFSAAKFTGGTVSFDSARFSGAVTFQNAQFSGGWVTFDDAQFPPDGTVNFGALFDGGTVAFFRAQFSGGTALFADAFFRDGSTVLFGAGFSDGTVDFSRAHFTGGRIDFRGAWFSGGRVDFEGAWFIGGTVNFDGAQFSGSEVDFSEADDWSCPPTFPWTDTDTPPPGVKLPRKADQSQA